MASIDSLNVVDAIGVRDEDGFVVLTLVDSSEWVGDHLVLLQAKLNRYLDFIEGGEVYHVYPQAKGRNFAIEVLCRFEPDSEGGVFLTRVKEIVEGSGVAFSWRVC